MLRFVVAGMAVVILALAGVTGFLAYEYFSEDDGGGWEAVSYKDKHDICQEFAGLYTGGNFKGIDNAKYQACMDCGPQNVMWDWDARTWYCR